MPERKKGTPSKSWQAHHHQQNTGKPPQASTPQGGGGGTNNAAAALAAQDVSLNPPFDPRMRRVGSPLNLASKIKRGWIQNTDGSERVNFLFNPPAIDLSNSLSDMVQNPQQKSSTDTMNIDYPSTGSTTGVSLLYDRTYELFSMSQAVSSDARAQTLGAYADIAAWQKFLKMIKTYPLSWSETLISQPLSRVDAYLFIGPNLYFYGFVNSFNASITHWTQNMVPQRAKVDIGFTILPQFDGQNFLHANGSTETGADPSAAVEGWVNGLFAGSSGGVSILDQIANASGPAAGNDLTPWLDN